MTTDAAVFGQCDRHDRYNTTAYGVGEYARDCKAITSDTGASTARVESVDGSGTILAEFRLGGGAGDTRRALAVTTRASITGADER